MSTSAQSSSNPPGRSDAGAVAGIVASHFALGALAATLAFVIFLRILDWVVDGGPGVARFDHTVLLWLHARQRPGLTEIARVLAWLGSPTVMVVIAVGGTVAGFVDRRIRGAAWIFPIAVIGAGLIIQGLKLGVHRVRPSLFVPLLREHGYSFPSGHSLIAVVVYGLIGYFAVRLLPSHAQRVWAVVATVLLIVAIGVSRPYVGVHYPTDVLAGWAAGVPWFIACRWLYHAIERRSGLQQGQLTSRAGKYSSK